MISFEYLKKPDSSMVAHEIFDVLADNMTVIAPTGNSRETDFELWFGAVSGGLQRAERQIILIKDNENLVGFFQYYTNADTFEKVWGNMQENIGILIAGFCLSLYAIKKYNKRIFAFK